jgi:hypothetical protein
MFIDVCYTKGPKIKKSSRRKTTYLCEFGKESEINSDLKNGKRPTSHRSTTYPCYVPILGESAGAGRVGLAGANIQTFYIFASAL